MIETGTVLQQRYKIDRQIGQGGMGAVYIATDDRFASTVAIKETLCMDDSFRKAIEREARLLNSLKHSALPKVTDHFEENNGMFIVMEYIPGNDLAAMLEDPNTRFTVDQVTTWADQLLDALDYLHNQVIPVIHRDIKPQNLKINSRGQIVLLDFGLAKGNPTEAGTNHTAAKSIFGYSRNYAALEQIQGTGTDPRSDLYSLAATLYHLLTRRPPDDALTRAMSVLSAKPDPLMPANVVNPEVPAGVAGVLLKAMDLNASERPASAAEMRQMLRESDNYTYVVEAAATTSQIDPRVFAQKTQLMPAGTQPIMSDPNAKTEVLPGYASQVTSVRPSDTGGQNTVTTLHAEQPKRRGMAAGIAAVGLFAVAALAGGAYMFQPGATAADPQPQVNQAAPLTQTAAEPSVASADAKSEAPAAEVGSADPTTKPQAESPRHSEQPAKGEETAKSTAPKATGKNKAEDGDGGEDDEATVSFEVDDPDIPPGGFTMRQMDENGKIKTMRVTRPRDGKYGVQPGQMHIPEPKNWENMPPEARKKLQEALKKIPRYNHQRPRPVPIPPRQPPPANNQ